MAGATNSDVTHTWILWDLEKASPEPLHVKGNSSLEIQCDHSKMAPSEVVQCMEHAPMKGIKIHCANNHIQLMS